MSESGPISWKSGRAWLRYGHGCVLSPHCCLLRYDAQSKLPEPDRSKLPEPHGTTSHRRHWALHQGPTDLVAGHQSFADGTGRIIASRSSVLIRIVLPQR
jgi:hypothetical protein